MQFQLESNEMNSEIVTLVSIMKDGFITEKVYSQGGVVYQQNVRADGIFLGERTRIAIDDLGDGWIRFDLKAVLDGIEGDEFRVFF